MQARDIRRHAEPARGILRRGVADGPGEHLRLLPPAALEPYVHHFWWVRWRLAAPVVAEGLPHPSVHVVFEEHDGACRAEIAGPHTGRFVKQLSGTGCAFGIKFRAGGFAPLLGRPMTQLTNRVVPLADVFGAPSDAWARATFAEPELDGRMALATAFLAPLLPPLPAEVVRVRDLVERMAADRTLVRVDDVSLATGIDLRTLQRSFRRFVGLSPKQVLRRFRLLEAVEQLKAEAPPSLAELALSLGYADQPHFARDFKRIIGRTPKSFATRTP